MHHFVAISSANSNWSYSPETLNCGENQHFSVLCDLEIWRTTLKNIRAPLLCHFKLSASFGDHQSIQIGVIVRKRSIRVKSAIFGPVWHWDLMQDLGKTTWHLFYATSSFVHHFVAICKFKLEIWSGNLQIGANPILTSVTLTFDLRPWPFAWTSLLSMAIKFHDNTMRET